MHPVIAPMIERNAYIGGCDGVATVKSAELIGIEPTGTMPHALILIMGDTLEAVQAFDRHIDKKVNRVCLIDTFTDEKFESLRIAGALGEKLFAIRLDTPGSRRGDLVKIMKEVRWELDLRGHKNVKLFVSGGLDSHTIRAYNEVADAYGVGTSLSAARVLDYSMDIVEIAGEPVAKRGKASGRKDVRRCPECLRSQVVPAITPSYRCNSCGNEMQSILSLVWDGAKWQGEQKSAQKIREYVLAQLRYFEGGVKIEGRLC
jgi:nicotinate phosphoribosyltransferase